MTTAEDKGGHRARLKDLAIEELKTYWVIVLYLAIFLGALTNYCRLVLAEFGVVYIHYGVAVIEALIIAKVILIGRAFGFSRWLEDRALVFPVLFKSVLFGALVFLFGIVERLVEGLFHKESLATIFDKIALIGVYELSARMLIVIVAFVPFFSFWELGRVIGLRRLAAMFFSEREARGEAQHPPS
ncbi:MAG TPA: hypothetical protein VKG21_08515 [Casimicrobiaceae bacterium]|nr:hypothetical protein [Casimicrobiaceae bacterium]